MESVLVNPNSPLLIGRDNASGVGTGVVAAVIAPFLVQAAKQYLNFDMSLSDAILLVVALQGFVTHLVPASSYTPKAPDA